jgi:hypothetical protein
MNIFPGFFGAIAASLKKLLKWNNDSILIGSLAAEGSDAFGASVSINANGDRIVVGAVSDERPGLTSNEGLAYVFVSGANGWTEQAILSGSLATVNFDAFGQTIAMNSAGDRIIIGASGDENISGSIDTGIAYIFISGANGWTEQQILSGSFATHTSDFFGRSVAMNATGNIAVVGAFQDEKETVTVSASYAENAYVFRCRDQFTDGWVGGTMRIVQGNNISSPVVATINGPVSPNGLIPVNTAVVLTPGLQYSIFVNQEGTFPNGVANEMRVEIVDPNSTTIFNQSTGVALNQIIHTWIAVSGSGAVFYTTSSVASSGLAYIFVSGTNGWTEQQILSGSLATGSSDNFGWSVAINSSGERIIVGAYNDERLGQTATQNEGLAYIFVSGSSGWTQQQILSASLATGSNDNFGYSVAINSMGDRVVIGARLDERIGQTATQNEGLAYVFVSGTNGWTEQAILSGTLAIQNGDLFAETVAINSIGDCIVIGARQDERISGSLSEGLTYIFVSGANGWTEQAILSGSFATGSSDNFGYSVAINSSGERIIVGAWTDERFNGAGAEGLAYIYDSNISQIINNFNYSIATSSINFGNLGTASFIASSSSVLLTVPYGYLYTPMNDIATVTISSSVSGAYTVSPSSIFLTPAYGGISTNISATYSPSTSGEITGLITISASVGTKYISLTGSSTVQRFMQTQILSGSLATGSSDAFGYSVAMNASGNIAVVGAWQDERPAGSAGEGLAYIFVSGTNGWTEQQILSGSLATGSGDIFGESVAINASGDRIIVGASQDERSSQISTHNEGLAYVFVSGTNGWTEQAILSGTLATGSIDRFGRSVATNTNGDRVIVGAFGDEKIASSEGLAYIFISGANGWTEQAILSGSLATGSSDNFGWSVSMNSAGDRVVVGAILDERSSQISGHNEGLAYIFVSGANGWTEQAILSGSFATGSSDGFGTSVTINASGNIVVVGAPTDETGSITSTGVAYIYTSGTSGWQQQQILSGPIGRSGDQFGYSVSITPTGNRIIVGGHQSYTSSVGGNYVGIAVTYVSGTNGWEQYQILTGSLAIQSLDQFGISVANNASGERVLIGANFDERAAGAGSEGLAYIMDLRIL